MQVSRRSVYTLFLVGLLTTEFFYINVGAGVARLYHFHAVLVILLLLSSIHRLFSSGVFLSLLAFTIVNFIAALLSDNAPDALASLTSFLANLAVSIAIALIMLRGKISVERFIDLLRILTIVSVVWGALQIMGSRLGLIMALSEQQLPQIQMGFGPGFRTEANTFAKYMVFPFLFFLPMYIKNPRNKDIRRLYIVMFLGVFMNFTRSAIVGIAAAFLFVFFWYALRGRFAVISGKAFQVMAVVAIIVVLIFSGALEISEYARYKLENLFNQEEIFEGGSSSYRLESIQAVIDNTLNDSKRFWIGNGWGQTYYEVRGIEVQAGGADVVNCLGFGGVIGAGFYLLYYFAMIFGLMKVASRCPDPLLAQFAEGLLFAAIGMLVSAQISGYMISPEYFLLLGLAIFTGLAAKSIRTTRKTS